MKALRVVVACVALAGLITGCTLLIAETPQQRLYAVVTDYKVALAAAADYCERPDASLTRCRELVALNRQATPLLESVQLGVANGTLGPSQTATVLRILADVLERMETK